MSEENSNKTNFFKEVVKSVKDLDKYEDFALEQPGKAFKYLIKLIAIFCVIICLFYTYQIGENIKEIYSDFKNKLPAFSYTAGTLVVDSKEPIIIEEYSDSFGKIIIDTNNSGSEIEEYGQDVKNGKVGIILLKNECIVLADNTLGQVRYKYEDLTSNYNITEFTKQDVINYIEGKNVVSVYASIYFIIFVYLFLVYGISILLDVLLLAVLAYVVSRILNIKLKYSPSFSVAVHSITLSVILNLIYIIFNLFTGFRIKYFQLMYSTISYIYVVVGILMIKTDFINRQMELIKLAQEQEKVREEMDKKQEDKEKQKEENRKPENDNKEEQKEKNNTNKRKKKNDEEKGVGADAPACQEIGKEA